jgi:hypothetical protein
VAGATKLFKASQNEPEAAYVVFTSNDSSLKYASTDL